MSRTLSLPASVFFGLLMSVISVTIALNTFTGGESKLLDVLLWNFYLAGFLAEKGWLPVCKNCELLTVMQVLFYGFIVGLIVYSAAFAGFLWTFNKLRSKKAEILA